jgi:hypothetical protein
MKNGPYIMVVAPADYPGARYRGRYVYEHHLVWYRSTGELVPPGHVVHHKDENKHNNAFDNLELKTRSEHSSEHGATGRAMTKLSCRWCDIGFERETRQIKPGQTNFFCARSHQAKYQREQSDGRWIVW